MLSQKVWAKISLQSKLPTLLEDKFFEVKFTLYETTSKLIFDETKFVIPNYDSRTSFHAKYFAE